MKLPISIMDLDAEKIGDALVQVAVISHVFGHDSVRSTVQNYVIPHCHDDQLSPEARFVAALFRYAARDVLIEEEVWRVQEANAARMMIPSPGASPAHLRAVPDA